MQVLQIHCKENKMFSVHISCYFYIFGQASKGLLVNFSIYLLRQQKFTVSLHLYKIKQRVHFIYFALLDPTYRV